MASASVTELGDVFIPQVVADLASDILYTKTQLLRSGYVVDAGGMAWGAGGNTITFPKWTTTLAGQVQSAVLDSVTGVTGTQVTMGSYTETVASKIISINMAQAVVEDIVASADINGHIAEIVAKESAADIQASLISKAESTDLELDITAETNKTMSVDTILRAKMKFGEYAADVVPAIFLHTAQFSKLAVSDDYKQLGSAATNAVVSVAPGSGAMAVVHGCLVFVSDAVTVTAGEGDDEDTYTALMLLPNALGLYTKRAPTAKVTGHAGSDVNTIDFSFRYATTLFQNQPRGCVKVITE